MAAIDKYNGIAGAVIYKSYQTVLCCANIDANNNKFYRMEIVTDGTIFYLFSRNGRVGNTGQCRTKQYRKDHEAIKQFCKVYFEKTGNRWGGGPFTYIPGKYAVMDVDDCVADTATQSTAAVATSTLDPKIKELIEMISSVSLMKTTLRRLDCNPNAPLGKLKDSQLVEAERTLDLLQRYSARDAVDNIKASLFEGDATKASLHIKNRVSELSSKFWSLVPNSFGMRPPPLINTEEQIKRCADLIEVIRGIKDGTKIVSDGVGPDQIYANIGVDISVVDVGSPEGDTIKRWVDTTVAPTHHYNLEIECVYKVDKNYPPSDFDTTPNHMLLFHGSRTTNFVSILTNGLRVPSSTQVLNGSVLGRGIYFAPVISKSFNYCGTMGAGERGLVLVCEVALGNVETVYTPNPNPPIGYDSRMALGSKGSDPSTTEGWSVDGSVEVPIGPITDRPIPRHGSFLYNEVVVFDEHRYRIRYLLSLRRC